MKKNTLYIKLRNIRLAESRERRESRFKRRLKKYKNKPQTSKENKPHPIQAPEFIELRNETSHKETCEFIDTIRHRAIDGLPIEIDFTKTKRVYTCGTLLLLAEIDRLRRILGEKLDIKANYPGDLTVEKVFQQIGLLKLLGLQERQSITEDDKTVYNWRAATGTAVDLMLADPMFRGIKEKLPVGYRSIVRGVEEAMTNVIHHAYELPRNDRLDQYPASKEKRWWVFAEVLDGWLHVVMCDLGIGIPRSLPTTWTEAVAGIMSLQISGKRKNTALVKRSFKVGKTRTELRHRGKGLKDIRQAAIALKGTLWLTTNQVQLGYDFSKDKPSATSGYYDESIMGTIIQWSIPLAGPVGSHSKVKHDPNQLSLKL